VIFVSGPRRQWPPAPQAHPTTDAAPRVNRPDPVSGHTDVAAQRSPGRH
jgi:hypothetical protein